MRNDLHDSEIEAFFHVEPIRAAIAITCTFCILWFLIVCILYRVARLTF